MEIEQLIILNKKLCFVKQYLPCYHFIPGVLITNNICIVDCRVKTIDCNFKGTLLSHYYKNGEYVHDVNEYDSIVFTSNVSLKLSQICNERIKTIFFMKDVDKLIIDIDITNNYIPKIKLRPFYLSKIRKILDENHIGYGFFRN